MRVILVFAAAVLAALAVAGCSRAPDTDAGGRSAPNVAVTAAPGVAFAYRYAFALPADRLSAAQEAHARACEALGTARCRVVGLRYRVNGRDDAEGRLEMRLAPDLARRFGQQGVEAVRTAGGRLTDAEATGTDAGAELERLAAEQAAADARERVARSRAATARDADRRGEQAVVVEEAGAQRSAARAAMLEQRRALASTPVVFDYASGSGLPVFDTGSPLGSAAAAGLASVRATLAFGLGAAAILGPPALLLMALLLLARRLHPAWRRLVTAATATPA